MKAFGLTFAICICFAVSGSAAICTKIWNPLFVAGVVAVTSMTPAQAAHFECDGTQLLASGRSAHFFEKFDVPSPQVTVGQRFYRFEYGDNFIIVMQIDKQTLKVTGTVTRPTGELDTLSGQCDRIR